MVWYIKNIYMGVMNKTTALMCLYCTVQNSGVVNCLKLPKKIHFEDARNVWRQKYQSQKLA